MRGAVRGQQPALPGQRHHRPACTPLLEANKSGLRSPRLPPAASWTPSCTGDVPGRATSPCIVEPRRGRRVKEAVGTLIVQFGSLRQSAPGWSRRPWSTWSSRLQEVRAIPSVKHHVPEPEAVRRARGVLGGVNRLAPLTRTGAAPSSPAPSRRLKHYDPSRGGLRPCTCPEAHILPSRGRGPDARAAPSRLGCQGVYRDEHRPGRQLRRLHHQPPRRGRRAPWAVTARHHRPLRGARPTRLGILAEAGVTGDCRRPGGEPPAQPGDAAWPSHRGSPVLYCIGGKERGAGALGRTCWAPSSDAGLAGVDTRQGGHRLRAGLDHRPGQDPRRHRLTSTMIARFVKQRTGGLAGGLRRRPEGRQRRPCSPPSTRSTAASSP